jgi:hypothetical protein
LVGLKGVAGNGSPFFCKIHLLPEAFSDKAPAKISVPQALSIPHGFLPAAKRRLVI